MPFLCDEILLFLEGQDNIALYKGVDTQNEGLNLCALQIGHTLLSFVKNTGSCDQLVEME